MKSQFLIAAPSSGSGKTTITLGLLRLLKNKGHSVQPFKCGPDYIDTRHHTLAANTSSINLDTFMMSAAHVRELYAKYSGNAEISITEGVMGLFDGANKMQGSSAEIAILLNLPVILVINAKAMAYSAAPLIYGFKHFNPQLNIAGVIFNSVNTESHYSFLKDACEDAGVEALGYVPVNERIGIPSRHLGLAISEEHDYESIIQNAAEHLEKTVNVERLLELCSMPLLQAKTEEHTLAEPLNQTLNIAIAKDAAFNFTYHENIEALQRMGKVTYFSPMKDERLPPSDLLYLPGGYPELYLKELTSNVAMRESIHAFCESGGRVIAECGGMMYLGKAIVDKDGTAHPMANFLDIETSMLAAKLSLGYRTIRIGGDTLKGHEFHYSTSVETSAMASIAGVSNAKGLNINTPVYRKKNVLASYIHFYWGEHRSLFKLLNMEHQAVPD